MNYTETKCKLSAAIINLGCKVNKYESDSMKDKLIKAGFVIVEPEEIADIYIVNTCAVTNMAQKKSRQMLRRAKKKNPSAIVVATGCYVNAEHESLKEETFVDLVVGNNCKKDIVEEIREFLTNSINNDYYIEIGKTSEYEEMGEMDAAFLDRQRAYIKIQDGCNQFCSYCIIPYTRGRVRSRKASLILSEIEKMANKGVKEFVLTGIHISSYGTDFNEESGEVITDLGMLVEAIADIENVKRVRLGSLEPRIITAEFLDKISKTDKLCPHFHLSLQSACNDTLKRMNRKYTIEEFSEKCDMLRRTFDRPAITTDVIVGFPGETEEEFATTMEHLRRIALYEIHVFKYSVREGTVAQKMDNQIPEEIKNIRSEQMLALTASQKADYEHALQGVEDEVLVEMCVDEDVEALTLGWVHETETVCNLETTSRPQYYVGHTKRYVQVKVQSDQNLVNEIVKVCM